MKLEDDMPEDFQKPLITWRIVVGGLIWGAGVNIGLNIAAPSLVTFGARWWCAVAAISILTIIGDAFRYHKDA